MSEDKKLRNYVNLWRLQKQTTGEYWSLDQELAWVIGFDPKTSPFNEPITHKEPVKCK